jgi:hypothetical protein
VIAYRHREVDLNAARFETGCAPSYEIMKLNAVALATGFAGAALVVSLIFAVPMRFSMMGAYGAHMPGGVGYGMGYGMGAWMLLGGVTWLVVAAAIAGAIVALLYNAIAKSP